MISTENLTKVYGSVTALDRLGLEVKPGEVFGLIGPNGAGKTTTLRILATLLRPTTGQARIDGLSLAERAGEVRRRIGYVPDAPGIYPDAEVEEYLRFFAALYGIRGRKAERTVRDVLALTDLESRRDSPLETLSRGMLQRLSVARVLLHDPKVLLLDEPASGLDPRARVELRGLLRELCRMEKTVVVSSHILTELAELCTSVGVLQEGRLLYHGTLEALIRRARPEPVLYVRVAEAYERGSFPEGRGEDEGGGAGASGASVALPASAGTDEAGASGAGPSTPAEPGTGTTGVQAESAEAKEPGMEGADLGEYGTRQDADAEANGAASSGAEATGSPERPERARAWRRLAADPRVVSVEAEGEELRVRLLPREDPARVPTALVREGFRLLRFGERLPTLEDAFLHLTDSGHLRPDAADAGTAGEETPCRTIP